MIAAVIRWSLRHRLPVLLVSLLVGGYGLVALLRMPLDALPDLSDVQVIVRTTFPGQSPQIVENLVTTPLATALRSVPGAVTVRGDSFYGDSFLYVLFRDGTDPTLARTRVLEQLSLAVARLPEGARPALGPDGSGVGWVYQYALVDRSGRNDLTALRRLQDSFLKLELQSVPGVAEVATVGGMARQYQVTLDPLLMRDNSISLMMLRKAIQSANRDTGGGTIEMAEAEYRVHSRGLLTGIEDLRRVYYTEPGMSMIRRLPAPLSELADIRLAPQMRQGLADLDGEGEVAGGIVVMRNGENALHTIDGVKRRLAELRHALPKGVEVVEAYDRSDLILRAVGTLRDRLIEEFIVIVLVCAAFLLHARSALVLVISLPLGILAAFAIMQAQGIGANLMSLGGIAIAVGAMVDAAIVMLENAHKKLEGRNPNDETRTRTIVEAMTEVGPPVFFSLLIITVSFLPVFALESQEGRLFAPLAFTKTWAMAAAAGLSVTLVPVLIAAFLRGPLRAERDNPVNRGLIRFYQPLLGAALDRPRLTLALAGLAVLTTLLPLAHLGSEFLPDFDEGDLLYMPSIATGVSIGKAREILQQTDRRIRAMPEVARVFGKAGRAETATDPAPLAMIETVVQLKPRDAWRPGLTLDDLKRELDERTHLPGVTNAWIMPIRARLDMLATGIRTPVGVKISGPDLITIEQLGQQVAQVVGRIDGTVSAYAERLGRARYVDVRIDRDAAARSGFTVEEIQETIGAVGGMPVGDITEGRERVPIALRYPPEYRDSVRALAALPLVSEHETQARLGELAQISIKDGPDMLRSENARLTGWVLIDIRDRDLGSFVAEAQRAVAHDVALPPGYALSWSGQFEAMQRAHDRLLLLAPFTLALILLMLYFVFRNSIEPLLVMAALPLALIGGVWLLALLGYDFSVAVGVGFLALAGLAAEFGIVMLVYLDQAVTRHRPATRAQLRAAVIEGAVQRVRPKAMTVAVILGGLLPILVLGGTGSELTRRIAAPMVGGMITAPLVSMLLIPVLYLLWQARRLARHVG